MKHESFIRLLFAITLIGVPSGFVAAHFVEEHYIEEGNRRMDAASEDRAEKVDDNSLREDLAMMLNKHSAENGSNTPDFVLAKYLADCLKAYDEAVRMRDSWYGHEHRPGEKGGRP
jgi:hypothetical protein